ncbi:MAG TPA: asparagine synthase-related protein, partial [Ignavibacteriaceae bacterium]|nr:asparagine synthase-related protein [Ignavibacteriaceae bacterium]
MIGLSGLIGNLNPSCNYNKKFLDVHAVNGITMHSYNYHDDISAISLISRSELFEDSGNDLFIEDEEYILVIDGYINYFNNKYPNRALHVLNLWKEKNESFIKDLNGEYNICIYNKKKKELNLFNDRFASRNFFYLIKKGTFYFGSEIKSILSVLPDKVNISPSGLMEFFLFSHNLADNTLFQDIKTIPPSTILKYRDGKLLQSKYWDLNFDTKNTNQKTFTHEMFELLKKAAIEKCSNKNKLGMGLSGGLDSRVIAASIPSDLRPIYARTFGDENSSEVIVAKEIAERLNFEHHIHTPKQVLYSDFLFPSVWRTECSVHFVGLKSIIEHKYLKDKMLYNLGGQFGDVLTGKQLRPFMFFPQKKDAFINKVFDHYISFTYKSEEKI